MFDTAKEPVAVPTQPETNEQAPDQAIAERRAVLALSARTYAQMRTMDRVQPKWWVRTFGDDGEEFWSQVTVRMDVESILTGRKGVRLLCKDPLDLKSAIETVGLRDTEVACCNIREAKQAGLEASQ